jgi:hypothetical protein
LVTIPVWKNRSSLRSGKSLRRVSVTPTMSEYEVGSEAEQCQADQEPQRIFVADTLHYGDCQDN